MPFPNTGVMHNGADGRWERGPQWQRLEWNPSFFLLQVFLHWLLICKNPFFWSLLKHFVWCTGEDWLISLKKNSSVTWLLLHYQSTCSYTIILIIAVKLLVLSWEFLQQLQIRSKSFYLTIMTSTCLNICLITQVVILTCFLPALKFYGILYTYMSLFPVRRFDQSALDHIQTFAFHTVATAAFGLSDRSKAAVHRFLLAFWSDVGECVLPKDITTYKALKGLNLQHFGCRANLCIWHQCRPIQPEYRLAVYSY